MKKIILLYSLFVFIVSCGGDFGSQISDSNYLTGLTGTTDITGNWSGDWKSSSGIKRGIISIDLTQSGISVNGTASISGFPCMTDGNISGSLSGRNITFDIVSVSGTDIVSYSGKVTSPAINGSYAVINWACALDHGTFKLTRQ